MDWQDGSAGKGVCCLPIQMTRVQSPGPTVEGDTELLPIAPDLHTGTTASTHTHTHTHGCSNVKN